MTAMITATLLPVLAQTADVPADTVTHTVTLDPLLVNLIGGAVIPLLVAISTKYGAGNWLKSLLSFFLAAVVGTLNTIVQADGTFEIKAAVINTLIAFIAAVAAYRGFWEPTVDVNARLAPNAGLGSSQGRPVNTAIAKAPVYDPSTTGSGDY